MKNKILFQAIALGLLIGSSPAYPGAQDRHAAEVLLGAALHQEEVKGDLEAAIATYRKFLETFADIRPLAAKAQFRVGRCYEKLGRTEAQKAYEEVLKKYADQAEFASQARQRLAALAGPGSKTLTLRRLEDAPYDSGISGRISPDGRYLTHWFGETGDLALRDIETGQVRRLTTEATGGVAGSTDSQGAEGSAWSFDGKRIAYAWHVSRAGESPARSVELRIIGLDGGTPRRLARFEGATGMTSIAWSRDGRHIAACVDPGNAPPRIHVVSVADGASRGLIDLKREIYPTTLCFSPDGGHLAYDRLPDPAVPERDIYLAPVDSGEEIPWLRHPADDYLLDWSADGNWLVFASDRKGSLGLWAVGVSGLKLRGEPVLIKPGIDRILPVGLTRGGALYYGSVKASEDIFVVGLDPVRGVVAGPAKKAAERYEGGNFSPSYSPDGMSLAYISRRGNSPYPTNAGNALCIRSLVTGEERVIYREFWRLGIQHLSGPEWSPDGRFIVLHGSERRTPPAFYRVDLESGQVARIRSFGPEERGFGGILGAGGSYLYVRRSMKDGLAQILALDIESGKEKELRRFQAQEFGASIALSPDGRWLAVANFGWGLTRSLGIMPAAGGEIREIKNFGDTKPGMPPLSLAWTPDGRHVLYGASDPADMRNWELWRIPVEGGSPASTGLRRMWGIWGLSVRPDGRELCFAGRGGPSTDSEMWVLENFLPPPPASN